MIYCPKAPHSKREDAAIAVAREMETDELELDDSPIVSASDIDDPEDGAWVRAWVWVDAGSINAEFAKTTES